MTMKKIILPLLAALFCMTACQKENDGILTLEVEHYTSDAKVHLDGNNFAVWDYGDKIWLNGSEKTVDVTSTTASITGIGDGPWTAIYPYSWAQGATTIIYPAVQTYRVSDDKQVIDAPMVAYCAAGERILRFRNLGSILAVNVSNETGMDMMVLAIEVSDFTDGSPNKLSGTATISGLDSDSPSATFSGGSNKVTLDCGTGVPIAAGGSHTFYIALPTISNARLRINVDDGSSNYTRTQYSATTTFARSTGHIVPFSTSDATKIQYALKTNQIEYTSRYEDSINMPYTLSGPQVNNAGRWVATSSSIITSVPGRAFYSQHRLATITLPNTVATINTYAFRDCSNLTSITLPKKLTRIGDYAFGGCTSLSSVSLPNSVTRIGEFAFDGCTSLSYVYLPNSLTEIGKGAFRKCTSLSSITLPNNLTSIESFVFDDCTSLTSVTLPSSLTGIGGSTFRGCIRLGSIALPNSLTSIGGYAFDGCISLSSVSLPSSVTEIGDYAFRKCTSFSSITLPDNLTSIGSHVFDGCTNLSSVTLPNSLTSIGGGAFYNCTGLGSITLPNRVTSIGNAAFYNCTGLRSITLPNSLTNIESCAFDYCTGLTSITYSGTISQWRTITKGSDWNRNVPNTCVVHCTDGDCSMN